MLKRILGKISIVWNNIFWKIVTLFYKKDENLCVIGGWGGQRFADNSRYMFLEKSSLKKVWVTESEELYEFLKESGYKVVLKGSKESRRIHLRAKYHVTDWGVTDIDSKYSVGAQRIFLWHGIPLKKVWKAQFDNSQNKVERILNKMKVFAASYTWGLPSIGCWDNNELLVTSQFVEELFDEMVTNRRQKYIHAQYPRVSYLREEGLGFLLPREQKIVEEISKYKEEGYKVVMYLPTFRDAQDNPFLGEKDKDAVNSFFEHMKNEKILFIAKPHMADAEDFNNRKCMVLEATVDIYPFLKMTDCLITDYSSVAFDYLALDRPIIYYVYDYEDYRDKDRGLALDFDENTAGTKVYSLAEVQRAIDNVVQQGMDDGYGEKRKQLLEKIYTPEYQKVAEVLQDGMRNVER